MLCSLGTSGIGRDAMSKGNSMPDLVGEWRWRGWWMMCRGNLLWFVELWEVGKGGGKGDDRYIKMNEYGFW